MNSAYEDTTAQDNPKRYRSSNGIDFIDIIDAVVEDKPGFEAFCIGNALKYMKRYNQKGGSTDLKKAQDYLNWAYKHCYEREEKIK